MSDTISTINVNDLIAERDTLREEVERLTDENLENANGWNTSLGLAEFWTECVKIEEARANKAEAERDAAIARAEKAEATLADLAARMLKVLEALNVDYKKSTDGEDQWKRGYDEGIKSAASITHAVIPAARASLTEGE